MTLENFGQGAAILRVYRAVAVQRREQFDGAIKPFLSLPMPAGLYQELGQVLDGVRLFAAEVRIGVRSA